jgi:hypothetical protein
MSVTAGAYTATLYVMRLKGVGRAPHPHQPGQIFPSWDVQYARNPYVTVLWSDALY